MPNALVPRRKVTQTSFARSLLKRLDITPTHANLKAMVGWQNAEGGHWHNTARHNPLNTTQPMPGAGNTGSQGNIKVYRTWRQGVKATARTLKNGRYNTIIAALKSNDPGAVASAIDASPWGTHGPLVRSAIATARPHGGGRQIGAKSKGAPRPAASATSTTPGVPTVETRQETSFDRAGFEQARKRALVGSMLAARKGTGSILFKSGLLTTTTPNPADFTDTSKVTTVKPGKPTAAPDSGLGAAAAQPGRANDQVQTAIRAAQKNLGVAEVNGSNRGKRVDKWQAKFGMVGQPWCGIGVGIWLRRAGVQGITPRVASVTAIEEDAKSGRNGFASWHSPQHAEAGDALVTRRGEHVGFVVGVDRKRGIIKTIEANTGNGEVARRTHPMNSVYGVARPKYRH